MGAEASLVLSREAELIAEMTPLIADLANDGRGAVALAGSRAKGRADARSDYDFRVYAHAYRGPGLERTEQWQRFEQAMRRWSERGFRMDGVWMRSYAGVERDLAAWVAGTPAPKRFEWTIWDYQLPTDLASQQIVHDPEGRLLDWQGKLQIYPEALREALLHQYREIISYWAGDYHYESKVERQDLVFLVGLNGKLANALLQVVFAANRVYYPGDGWNLPMAAELENLPPRFIERLDTMLQPGNDRDNWKRQRAEFIALTKDVEAWLDT